jgi:hypothetical protein
MNQGYGNNTRALEKKKGWISKVVEKSVEIVLREERKFLKVALNQKHLGFWEGKGQWSEERRLQQKVFL